jgi:hypothetical protein
MVKIENGKEPEKVPLIYYDKYGERHVIGDAAVQIRDGEVIAVGKIEPEITGDLITGEVLQGINLEAFSMSVSPKEMYVIPAPNPADVAARRLGPLSLENRKYVTDTNPNGAVKQCNRRDLHEPHEYQAEFGAYFNVYCLGNEGSKR